MLAALLAAVAIAAVAARPWERIGPWNIFNAYSPSG